MRTTRMFRVLFGVAVVSMFSAGVAAAAAPLASPAARMLCMFHVSSCAGTECTDTCFNCDPNTVPVCNSSNLCCNCFL